MPWIGGPVEQRKELILAIESGECTMTEVAERFGVSRKSVYKWLRRFEELGDVGLEDRSRRPIACPHQTSEEVERLLVSLREKHKYWGPKKILATLAAKHPELSLPAASTAGSILKRYGLVESRRRRTRFAHPGRPVTVAEHPNSIWAADFKGQFRMRNGSYCYPLTVSDEHSRFLLGCVALTSTASRPAERAFTRLFREYGLPDAIRTDNGVPFCSPLAIRGLSPLSILWIRLGIRHDRIEPGQPQQNGRHERMHRTLKAETTRPAERNLRAQQERFDRFRQEFNDDRPHEGIDMRTPATVWRPPSRSYPKKLAKPEYPSHFEVRRVSFNTCIRFKKSLVSVSTLLRYEDVGLEEVDNGIWAVHFYDRELGRFAERDLPGKDGAASLMRLTQRSRRAPLQSPSGLLPRRSSEQRGHE